MKTYAWAAGPVCLSLGAFALLTLAACDGAPSASAARSHAAGEGVQVADRSYDQGERQTVSYVEGGRTATTAKADPDADAPRFHGKPIWAGNKTHSGQDNADYQFKKNGEDLGVTSEDAFIAKAHDFVDHPPKGAETLTRANGDVLIYDAKSNLFAVADKEGAPRTVFKPRDGAAYWTQQKAEADKPYTPRTSTARKSSGADDNG